MRKEDFKMVCGLGLMDIRYWCPFCGSKNTQMIVFESDENAKIEKGTLRCHDCGYEIDFKEIVNWKMMI